MGFEEDSCPPQSTGLGISSQNRVEAPASLSIPVLSGRMVQSTGPGEPLKKVKFISVHISAHHDQPTQDLSLFSLPN